MLLYTKPASTPLVDQIVAICAEYFGVTIQDVKGKGRLQDVVRARHCAMYFSRQHTRESLVNIGRQMNADHTTVIHAIKAVNNSISLKDNHIYPFIEPLEHVIRQTKTYNQLRPTLYCMPIPVQATPLIETFKKYTHV